MEAEIPRVRMNPKNPTSRERNNNMKIQDMLSTGVGVLLVYRTGADLCITKNGVVRGKSWTEGEPEVEPRRFYVLSADNKARGHTGGGPGCAALASHGKATKPHNDECRERIRTIIERTLTGKARMNAYKDRIAETERVKERKRARVERGAGDITMEPENRADEQVAVRHADASGGDI